jgi:isochorismate pyruvate lyase
MRVLAGVAAALFCGAAWAGAADIERPAYWGEPSVDGGKCCQTLAQVRANIDRIDHALLADMAERGRYVAEAGRFKKDPAAVSDPARVQAILARVGKLAQDEGLAPEVAQKTYAAMIAAFEDYERAQWLKAHPVNP